MKTVYLGCLPALVLFHHLLSLLHCHPLLALLGGFRNLHSLDSRRVKVTVVVDNLETSRFKRTMPQNIVSLKSGYNGGIDL